MDQAQTGRPQNGAVTPHQHPADLFAHLDEQGDRLAIWTAPAAMLEASGTVVETNQDGTILVCLPTSRVGIAALLNAILAATGTAILPSGGLVDSSDLDGLRHLRVSP